MRKGNEQQFTAKNGLTLAFEYDSIPVRVQNEAGVEVFRLLLSGGTEGRTAVKLASGEYTKEVAQALRELADHLGIEQVEWERRKNTRHHKKAWNK